MSSLKQIKLCCVSVLLCSVKPVCIECEFHTQIVIARGGKFKYRLVYITGVTLNVTKCRISQPSISYKYLSYHIRVINCSFTLKTRNTPNINRLRLKHTDGKFIPDTWEITFRVGNNYVYTYLAEKIQGNPVT